jgi:hypothetical protein
VDAKEMNVWILRIIGIILIILPIITIIILITTDEPVPIIGSPFVILILWIIGGILIIQKPKI